MHRVLTAYKRSRVLEWIKCKYSVAVYTVHTIPWVKMINVNWWVYIRLISKNGLWSEHVYMLKGHESGNHDWVLPFHAPSLVVISIKINLDKVLTLNRPALFIESAGRGNPY